MSVSLDVHLFSFFSICFCLFVSFSVPLSLCFSVSFSLSAKMKKKMYKINEGFDASFGLSGIKVT